MNRLTSWQLYSLLVLFQLGTSVVFGLSSPAKQDAWITVLISALPGGALYGRIPNCLRPVRMPIGPVCCNSLSGAMPVPC